MTALIITLPIIAYAFIMVTYGRYIYLRHTWKYAWGDELPAAVFFGLFWPVAMLVQFALFLGATIHYKTPKKG